MSGKKSTVELPIIDLALGASILGGDIPAAKRMLEQLVKLLPADLHKLKTLASLQNHKELQDLAHYIKGGASYCGTPRLQKAAADLEEAIINRNNSTVIKINYEKLCAAIEALLKAAANLNKDNETHFHSP